MELAEGLSPFHWHPDRYLDQVSPLAFITVTWELLKNTCAWALLQINWTRISGAGQGISSQVVLLPGPELRITDLDKALQTLPPGSPLELLAHQMAEFPVETQHLRDSQAACRERSQRARQTPLWVPSEEASGTWDVFRLALVSN